MDNQQSENRIKKLENQIQSLEKWKAEKEKQQIAFPLDIRSIEILQKYFMHITEEISTEGDLPGSYITRYLGKQDNKQFDVFKNTFLQYTVDIENNILKVLSRSFEINTQIWFTTEDTAPNPIDTSGFTDYYVINPTNTTFQITTVMGDAGSIVDITDIGVGRQYIYFFYLA